MLDRLAGLGVSGVEVAPTRLAGWDALPTSLLASYRARLAAAGLVASSLQALLYGRPELQLLGEGAAFDGLADHMRHVTDIAATLGAGVLVFGAPRNRLTGAMDTERAWARGRERFWLIGEISFAAGVVIGIEPVPAAYGGEFLTSWSDVLRMVREVDHPGVRVHLDTACVALGGDVIGTAITHAKNWLAHFHVAQPQLADFQDLLPDHKMAAAALQAAGYNNWIVIEMKEPLADMMAAAEQAIRVVREMYLRDGKPTLKDGTNRTDNHDS